MPAPPVAVDGSAPSLVDVSGLIVLLRATLPMAANCLPILGVAKGLVPLTLTVPSLSLLACPRSAKPWTNCCLTFLARPPAPGAVGIGS